MFRRIFFTMFLFIVSVAAAAAYIVITEPAWYLRWQYPLEYEEMIVMYSRKNDLDPALVAAVINQESGFDNTATSNAGAVGLMQVMPGTAGWIADKTEGVDFVLDDLTDPEINIAYGCWYLGHLMERYSGSLILGLAAYNGGAENVDSWVAAAVAEGREFSSVLDIPYEETREFVEEVNEDAAAYRKAYPETFNG